MQIVEQTPNRLVLRQSPWIVRTIGVVATISALLVIGAMAVGGARGNHELWGAALVVFSIIACGGLLGMLIAVDRRIVLDRDARTAELIQTGGLKRSQMTQVQFSEIRDVALEVNLLATQRDNAMPGYRIVFVLRDGSTLPWTALATSDIGTQSTCAAAARAFGGWDTAAARSGASPTEVARPTPAPGVTVLRPTPRTAAMASAATTPTAPRVAVVMAFLGIIALAGALATLSQLERLVTWRSVPAVIEASRVEAVRGSKGGTTYRPVVTYAYRVGDRTYYSSTVTVILESRSWSWASGIAIRYRPGASTTAYVNPKDPRRAFLVHDLSPFPLVLVVIPLVFAGLVSVSVKWQRQQLALAATAPVPIITPPSAVRPRAA
jgi:Protein of unknown function (DUF3592)